MHKKTISNKYLKALSETEANAVNTLLKLSGEFSIKPGQKLCYDCFNACNSFQSSEPSEQNRDDVDKSYYDADAGIDSLNITFAYKVCHTHLRTISCSIQTNSYIQAASVACAARLTNASRSLKTPFRRLTCVK